MEQHPDELHAIVRRALQAPMPLTRYRPNPPRRATYGDALLLALGDGADDLREVIVLGPSVPGEVFALAAAFFGAEARYGVIVDAATAAPMEAALRAGGWHLDEEEPALVLTPLPEAVPPPPPGLVIRLVTDEAGLADFRAVSGTGTQWVPSLAAATDPAVGLFVGYVAARPVATARFAVQDGVADINGVVTVPAARRRGYATALTWACIAAGRARGCTAADLTATVMGYPVYRKMGFVPVCTFRTYLPPGEPAS